MVGKRWLEWVHRRSIIRGESAHEPARVRIRRVIHATDDGLVRLNDSIWSVRAIEVLL